MTKNNMANNNQKWLLYGFIILAILNIILLGYIVMGLGGKGVGLSPGLPSAGCSDTDFSTVCQMGDYGVAQMFLGKSYIQGIPTGNKLKISGISGSSEGPTNVEINGNLKINSPLAQETAPSRRAKNVTTPYLFAEEGIVMRL